jgi:hypothetical protein
LSIANPQYAKADIWDGFKSAIQTVVDGAGNLIMSFYDASGTNKSVYVPVASLDPVIAAMIGEPSGGGVFYKIVGREHNGLVWDTTVLYSYTQIVSAFVNSSSLAVAPESLCTNVWPWMQNLDNVEAVHIQFPSGIDNIYFYPFTDQAPCTDPGVNNTTNVDGYQYHRFRYEQTTVGTCPDPLVESQGFCWYPDAAGNVPTIVFNADGTISLAGGEDDVPVGTTINPEGTIDLAVINNPDLELQGTAVIQKDPAQGLEAIETYQSTVDKEDGTGQTGVTITVTKTWDSDGNVKTKITGFNYGDASTPKTGDRVARNTWINNSGEMVHSDPLPSTPGGAAQNTGSATTGDLDRVAAKVGDLSTDLSGVISAINSNKNSVDSVKSAIDGVKAGQCGGTGQPACEVNLGSFTSPGVHSGSGAVDTSAIGTAGVTSEIDQLKTDIDGLQTELKTALSSLFNPDLSATGELPSWSFVAFGETFLIELTPYTDILNMLANFMLLMASIGVVFVILD